MNGREVDLRTSVEQVPPGIVSLVGGGGKTSLLFALADSLVQSGRAVLCTTTTRMLRPDAADRLRVELRETPEYTPAAGLVHFVARPPSDGDNKVHSYPPETIDDLRIRNPRTWILVEADGAAGRPIKAPAAHEPVVPQGTALAVAVIGLGCFRKPFAADTAFRMEAMADVTGLRPGDAITPAAVARLVLHPRGLFKGVPPAAARILFCNQSDLPGAEAAGGELAGELLRSRPGFLPGVHVGSIQRRGLRCTFYPTE